MHINKKRKDLKVQLIKKEEKYIIYKDNKS